MATRKQRMAVFTVAQATGKLLTKPEYLNRYLTKYLALVKEYSKKNSSDIRWFDPGFLVCTQDDFEQAWERLEQAEERYWDEKLAYEDTFWT